MNDYRDQQRHRMLYKTPRDLSGSPLCHYCQSRPGSQMHELVNRAQTQGNKAARTWSFTATLCSWLCMFCHEKYAPTKAGEAQLWQHNFDLWGKAEVLADLERVTRALGFRPQVSLPEETT